MVGNYIPELDSTQELDTDEVTLFQELIGVLRWATEIGRVDILYEVSILSQYLLAIQFLSPPLLTFISRQSLDF